jgi:chemotaxis-related protein WspD
MSARAGVGNCWKRIGTTGDSSCPRLPELVHCRNCEAFAAAGRSLLDREPPEPSGSEPNPVTPVRLEGSRAGAVSVVVFALGEEWFALPTAALQKIVPSRQPHRIPHRRTAVLLGVVNIDGELVLCASLAAILEIRQLEQPAGAGTSDRLLVLVGRGQRWACPVDEVAGVHRTSRDELDPLPVTLIKAATPHCLGVFSLDGKRVALLDAEAVLASLAASVSGGVR